MMQWVARQLRGATPVLRSRTDLLNYLLEDPPAATTYLEIGVRDRRHNFDKVRATEKHGVDPAPRRAISHPMTSDAFFATNKTLAYDLIFIDGLHEAHQVSRDVANALAALNPGGAIVLHDCNPQTFEAQTDHYDGKKHWNGTVWKAWVRLRATRPDLAMHVVDLDEGCGVIRRGMQTVIPPPPGGLDALDYRYLREHRVTALNLISVAEFLAMP